MAEAHTQHGQQNEGKKLNKGRNKTHLVAMARKPLQDQTNKTNASNDTTKGSLQPTVTHKRSKLPNPVHTLKKSTDEAPELTQKPALPLTLPPHPPTLGYNALPHPPAVRNNPQYCAEYAREIMKYLRKLEIEFQPAHNYMGLQNAVNKKMRSVLVDWLVDVHGNFSLQPETLFLTVSVMDRFLALQEITKWQMQLLGVTAMLIACKYEEIYYPTLADFVYITAETYTKEDIKDMEMEVLRALDYSLGSPASLHFLRRYSRMAEVTLKVHTVARYLIELSLVDYHMLEFLPSQLAAASLALSMKVQQGDAMKLRQQSVQLYQQSGYSERDLHACMAKLAQLVVQAPRSQQRGVLKKYTGKDAHSLAKVQVEASKITRDIK